MAKTNPARSPKVTIVVDANVLYSENVDRFFNHSFSLFATEELPKYGLVHEILVPEIVLMERRRQMINKASTLALQVDKLQNLTGANWGLTSDVLAMHIDASVARQVADCGATVAALDASLVDWGAIVTRSADKLPPFSPEKEKGFKDAVVLEAVAQAVAARPSTPSIQRVLFLTADGLLAEASEERFAKIKNVLVLKSLDEVRTQLNAIAAHLSEEYLEKILPKAHDLFFVKESKSGIYYTEDVLGSIDRDFSGEMNSKPAGFSRTKIVHNYITKPPTFLSKDGQRLHFSSKLDRAVVATRVVSDPDQVGTGNVLSNRFKVNASEKSLSELLDSIENQEEITKDGSHYFDVNWSCTLSVNGRLSKPSLDGIVYRETVWKD